MLIAVQYRDGKFDMVQNMQLDKLIVEGGVSLFRRASGWVVVDRDSVRHPDLSGRYFMGMERRSLTN